MDVNLSFRSQQNPSVVLKISGSHITHSVQIAPSNERSLILHFYVVFVAWMPVLYESISFIKIPKKQDYVRIKFLVCVCLDFRCVIFSLMLGLRLWIKHILLPRLTLGFLQIPKMSEHPCSVFYRLYML